MTKYEGSLKRNERGRWEFDGIELTSGNRVEISIDENWINGLIEHWQGDYYWFSQIDGIHVILREGIRARIQHQSERRAVGT